MKTTNTNTIEDSVKESMITAEIYKKDNRIKGNARWGKNKSGLRFISSIDFKEMSEEDIVEHLSEKWNPKKGYSFHIKKTYQKTKNIMSGEMFYERYDTPHYCSPSSDSYWCM